jgi:hypothetical protein
MFWEHQSDGLAIFRSPEELIYYRLPLSFSELLITGERFHTKPLLSLIHDDQSFYLLAVSQKQIRLLQCTQYSADEIELGDLPTSLAEALQYDDPEKRPQFHTGSSTPGAGGVRSALFHGHGAGVDDSKSNILRYFQIVDKGIQRLLKGKNNPLVLAGVEYLLAIYRDANRYPHLIKKGVEGNPDGISPEVLGKKAWRIVAPLFSEAQDIALKQFLQRSNADPSTTSEDLEEILIAAFNGRVDTLFVSIDDQVWGRYDPSSNIIWTIEETETIAEDLLDTASAQTFLTGGTVYALEAKDIPSDSPIAAIFRY